MNALNKSFGSGKRDNIQNENTIKGKVVIIRGIRVILDSDLAELYGVKTSRLNEQVRRNIHKFPDDFMFRLTPEEFKNLKSQNATSSSGWGGRRYLPMVFTEHGSLQAANVLNSNQANEMSIFIVRAFIRIRDLALSNKKLSSKVEELESRISNQDKVLKDIITAIKELLNKPISRKKQKKIGYIK